MKLPQSRNRETIVCELSYDGVTRQIVVQMKLLYS
jgi:hypothetical protein